jgi:biopolymer transport protein ExbD
VLLIFFILTTSYAALQKMLEASDLTSEHGVPTVKPGAVKDSMITVTIKEENDTPVIRVEGVTDPVPKEALKGVLQAVVARTKKYEMLLDHAPQVPHGVVVAVLDAAKGAGITKVHTLVPKDELK